MTTENTGDRKAPPPDRITIRPGLFSGEAISIIVPYHGQYAATTRLLRSLLNTTRGVRYELILVDDASENRSYGEDLKSIPQVRVVRSETQVGFGGALLMGASVSQAPWISFLNSDVEIVDGRWLLELGRSLMRLRDQGVAMVSARMDKAPQGADPRLVAESAGDGADIILQGGYLPLTATLCHRTLFQRIGGFVEAYPYGMYEDAELAFRMRRHRVLQAICMRSFVKHAGGLTVEAVCRSDPQAAAAMDSNYDRFTAAAGLSK